MNNIDDKDIKILVNKAREEYERCLNESRVTNTNFLDLNEQSILKEEFKFDKNILFYGGYEEAERKVLFFLPDWLDKEDFFKEDYAALVMKVLRVSHKNIDKPLSHRDYLGSILGLGILRKKIGDILVFDDGADILILNDMEEFLLSNYFKAGRVDLSLESIDLDSIRDALLKFEYVKDTVASLRLDCILAASFKISRTKALKYIESGLVFVNGIEKLKPDFLLKEKDVLNIRGKGKCILFELLGSSRKDRIFVTIKRYV